MTVDKSHANWYAIDRAEDRQGRGVIYHGTIDVPPSKIIDAYYDDSELFKMLDELGVKYDAPDDHTPFYCKTLDEMGHEGGNISDIVYLPGFSNLMKKKGKSVIIVNDILEMDDFKTYILFDTKDFEIDKVEKGESSDSHDW